MHEPTSEEYTLPELQLVLAVTCIIFFAALAQERLPKAMTPFQRALLIGCAVLLTVVFVSVYSYLRFRMQEYEILRLLALSHSDMYGLDMVRRSSLGILRRGSIYVVLGELEDRGYITSQEDLNVSVYRSGELAIPRRRYRLTDAGRERWLEHEGISHG